MSLSASTLGSLIDANLSSAGAVGSNKTIFSNAVAAGIVMSIVGKSFSTVDVGTVPGTGTGSGTGLVGISASNMASLAVATMPTTGVNAQPMMTAIMNAVQAHLATATLTSTHTPVFAGSGTIVVGSIPVILAEMSGNIDSQLSSAGANGSNRTILANAIATGIVTEILAAATGTVTISGSPAGPPSPGGGSGTGVIS